MNQIESTPLVTPALLKHLRNKAGLTQTELAARVDVSQGVLSRYESGEVPIPLEVAVRLIDSLGLGIQIMVDEPKRAFAPVEPGDPYRDYCARLRLLREFIRSEAPEQHDGDLGPHATLEALAGNLLQLPRLVIAGRSDAGKSHVANCLLGTQALPTDYQPLTRVPIALIHRDSRPAFVAEECAMMRGTFDLGILLDETKFQEQLIASGGLHMLSNAVHSLQDPDDAISADWAVVFIESEILRACILVDTPGFAASSTDTDRAIEACRDAEMLIYCSPAVGCFNQDDHLRISSTMTALPCPEAIEPTFPPLSNFLFVISHAGPQISEAQIDRIRHDVARRFHRGFGDGLLTKRLNGLKPPPTEGEVAERIVPFWGELESRHQEMRAKVIDLLCDKFPSYRKRIANDTIQKHCEATTTATAQKITEWKAFLERWEDSKQKVREAEKNENARSQWVAEQRRAIEAAISQHRSDSVAQFRVNYSALLNSQQVAKIIEQRYSSQDDAKEEIGAYIVEQLKEYVGVDLELRSQILSEQINGFLNGYSSGGGRIPAFGFSVNATPGFDAFASFAGGLAGLTTFGALAVWATTLGNLGGYIIAAKVVGLLAAIGIPTSGVAAVVTTVSAFGGPIVFALALAVLAAVGALLFFWKSWQQRMAQKVCEEFEKQHVFSKIANQIEQYWTDSERAFSSAADAVERSWAHYLEELRSIVKADSKEIIEKRIQALERLNDFFARLPWFPFRPVLASPEGRQ